MTDIHIDQITIYALDQSTTQKIDEIHSMLQTLSTKAEVIMSASDDLKAEIEALQSDVAEDARVDRSAETAINFILGKLDAAIEASNSLPALRDAVRTIREQVGTSTSSLAAAVAAVPTDAAPATSGGTGDAGAGDGQATPASEPIGDGGSTEHDVHP